MPNIPTENAVLENRPDKAVLSYYEGDIDKHRHRHTHREDWHNLQRNNSEASLDNDNRVPSVNSAFLTRDNIPSSLPIVSSYGCLPHLAMSNVSLEHDMGNCHSECVPVEGRLADLSDNEDYCANVGCDADEGGIVILDESTEDEYEEAIRESSGNYHRPWPRMQSPSPNTMCATKTFIETRMGISQASMYENDSIVLEAIARVNALCSAATPSCGNESLDFEQLLREADDHNYTRLEDDIGDEGQAVEVNKSDIKTVSGQYFWQRKPFLASSNERSEPLQQSRVLETLTSQSHTPVRATRIRHDKYVVEISMLRSRNATSHYSDIREVMDIMANVELLHMWFDAIPAVFDSTIKDGGIGNSATSLSPPLNSIDGNDCAANNDNNRRYDGQWVEISTPPLQIPADSRISVCLRAVRVSIRSLLGFPPRIRSMIFVERSCGRMGMTLGPFPDGFLCNSGTMAYHTFNVRISNDEEIGDAATAINNRQYVVISDEVRLQRGSVDDDFFGRTRRTNCCICYLFRFILGLLEWALLYRWYQPDLASYMHQSCSSLEKLRSLVERGGESAAYHGSGELITLGDDWQGENAMRTLGNPLLG
ncbi:hypothetical protein ACHAW5_001280 [Stephanodiscus triporus]|uniref:Uncharacterized protein n=1 Tax=Stephanodiscus triporus TaxID=2934178 RepID=A0ABD3MW00_9STRA